MFHLVLKSVKKLIINKKILQSTITPPKSTNRFDRPLIEK